VLLAAQHTVLVGIPGRVLLLVAQLLFLEADPRETTDVAPDPSNAVVLAGLQERMLVLFGETHPHADRLAEGLSAEERLVWFCEPPDADADLDAR
jgi:hypothetical protein